MQSNADDHPTMTIHEASPELKASGKAIIAKQMADALREQPLDLNDMDAVNARLIDHGFGKTSRDALAERAVILASASH